MKIWVYEYTASYGSGGMVVVADTEAEIKDLFMKYNKSKLEYNKQSWLDKEFEDMELKYTAVVDEFKPFMVWCEYDRS